MPCIGARSPLLGHTAFILPDEERDKRNWTRFMFSCWVVTSNATYSSLLFKLSLSEHESNQNLLQQKCGKATLDPHIFVKFLEKHQCSRTLTTPSLLVWNLRRCDLSMSHASVKKPKKPAEFGSACKWVSRLGFPQSFLINFDILILSRRGVMGPEFLQCFNESHKSTSEASPIASDQKRHFSCNDIWSNQTKKQQRNFQRQQTTLQ